MGHARVDCVGFELAKSGQDGSFVLPSNPIGTDPTIHFYKKGLERNFAWSGDSNIQLIVSSDPPTKRIQFLTAISNAARCLPMTTANLERLKPLFRALDEEAKELGPLDPVDYAPNAFSEWLGRLIESIERIEKRSAGK